MVCTKNSVLQFDNHVFAKICGIAMSAKLAPAIATVYVGDLEEVLIEERDKEPDLWVRCIAHVFIIWTHTCREL